MTSSSGCWRRRCGPAESSPRCTPRTSGRRRPASTTVASSRSTSGRDRGAGIRVIAGETTGFAHTSRPQRARPAGGGRGCCGGGQPGRWRHPDGGADPYSDPTEQRRRALPGRGGQGRQGRAAAPCRRGRPVRRRRDRAGLGRLRRHPQAGARGQQRRAARRRRGRAAAAADQRGGRWRHRHADRLPLDGPHRRVRDLRHGRRRGARHATPPARRSRSSAPARRRRARCPW